MTLEEYNSKYKFLEKDFEKQRAELAKEYALSNSPAKAGDIVSNGTTTVNVMSIGVYLNWDKPCCFYKGVLHTKKLKPYKSKELGKVYEQHSNFEILKRYQETPNEQ